MKCDILTVKQPKFHFMHKDPHCLSLENLEARTDRVEASDRGCWMSQGHASIIMHGFNSKYNGFLHSTVHDTSHWPTPKQDISTVTWCA